MHNRDGPMTRTVRPLTVTGDGGLKRAEWSDG